MLFKYACGTEGRGTRSHHRVGWTNHTSEHMAHSIQRSTLENMTEITTLIFIAAVQAAVQLHVTNSASMKAEAQLLLCIRTASALLTRRSRAAHACSVKPALDILDIEENDFQQSTVFSASMSLSAVFII